MNMPNTTVRILGAALTLSLLVIDALSYKTWNLSNEVEELTETPPRSDFSPDSESRPQWPENFDPWSGNWDPTGQFTAARKRMDAMMQAMLPGNSIFSHHGFGLSPSSPKVSVIDEEDEYRIVVDMVSGQEVEVNTEMENGVLTISGKINSHSENSSGNVYGRSHATAQFSQSMTLPEPVDESAMKIDQRDDEIVIIIPKLNNS